MKFWKSLIIALLLTTGGNLGSEAAPPRMMWIDPRDPVRAELTPRNLDSIRSIGVDTVLLPALFEGRVQYRSNLLPTPKETSPSVLENLSLAREQGFQVGLYLQIFIHGGDSKDPSHLARLHPEWLSYTHRGVALKDRLSSEKEDLPFLDGFFLDPGIPRVREFMIGILTETIEKLSPDWVVLDQVRFPFPEPVYEGTSAGEQPYGYHPIARGSFQKEFGFDPILLGNSQMVPNSTGEAESKVEDPFEAWNQMRKESLDTFVQSVHELLIARYPKTRLAVVGYPDPFLARRTLFQDWPAWIEKGWIEAAILPNHHSGLDSPIDLSLLSSSIRDRIWLAGTLPSNSDPATFLAEQTTLSPNQGWVLFEQRPQGFATRELEESAEVAPLDRNLREAFQVASSGVSIPSDSEETPAPPAPRNYTAKVRALYGFDPDQPPFEGLTPAGIVEKLKDLGFNAVFGGSDNPEMRAALKDSGFLRFGEYPVFVGKTYWEKEPSSRPITAEGEPFPQQSWYAPLDPHQPWLREVKREALLDLVKEEELDGVWLDFIRFPVFWEEVPPKLIETSFSPAALTAFQEKTGIVPEGSNTPEMARWILANAESEWRRFRADTILDFVREVDSHLEEQSPNTLLGAFVLPWREEEYDHAIYRIAGQDLAGFSKIVDILSPMVYSHQLGHPPEWILERTRAFEGLGETSVYPIVQCFDQPTQMKTQEVEDAIRHGMLEPSDGVILFSQRHLETSGRWESVRRVLNEQHPPSTSPAPLSSP